MSVRYAHLELGKDIECGIAGYYTPQKEVRLKYDGREVLYLVGYAVVEASCCGGGSWRYASVPGYIVNWQNTKNELGQPLTEVEPISDEAVRANLRQLIKDKESVNLVEF